MSGLEDATVFVSVGDWAVEVDAGDHIQSAEHEDGTYLSGKHAAHFALTAGWVEKVERAWQNERYAQSYAADEAEEARMP